MNITSEIVEAVAIRYFQVLSPMAVPQLDRVALRLALKDVFGNEPEPTNILSWREYEGEMHGQLQEIVNELGEELKREEK